MIKALAQHPISAHKIQMIELVICLMCGTLRTVALNTTRDTLDIFAWRRTSESDRKCPLELAHVCWWLATGVCYSEFGHATPRDFSPQTAPIRIGTSTNSARLLLSLPSVNSFWPRSALLSHGLILKTKLITLWHGWVARF